MTNHCNSNGWLKPLLGKFQGGTETQPEVVQFMRGLGEGGGQGMKTPSKRVKASVIAFGEQFREEMKDVSLGRMLETRM